MSNEDLNSLYDEIKTLQTENKRLKRELKNTESFITKIQRTLEAKDQLSKVLSIANTKQRAYTDMLLESCPNIIFLLDETGRFVLCTKVFLIIAGYHNFDYIKNRTYAEVFADLISDDLIALFKDTIDKVLNEKRNITLSEYIDFNNFGERYYNIEFMIVEGTRGNDAGITAGILAVFTDCTEIIKAKERSDKANNAKSEFLASMSHEIRTPMNAIIGLTDVMLRLDLNDQQRKYITDISHSSQSLLSIINDILDFSKIEAGKIELIYDVFDLYYLLNNIVEIFKPMFESKGLNLLYTINDNLPHNIYGDENRIRQIIVNVLSNALKYTNEGHVELSAELTDDNLLKFDIIDTGIGIKETDMKRLMSPFEQLDTHRNKNVTGTGLGLAITNNLCKIMNGRLSIKSTYGLGSIFTIFIPYISTEDKESNETEILHKEFSAPQAKVLIVDDIEINLTVAEAMLNIFNIEPLMSLNGREAIKLAQQNEFDIIFMDQMMPEMDGIETMEWIRETNEYNKTVPIIALTANVINNADTSLINMGFDGFLGKPIDLNLLNECLRKWLTSEYINEQ